MIELAALNEDLRRHISYSKWKTVNKFVARGYTGAL